MPFTGKYRGPADSIFNSKFNVSIEISVVFHNGSNYDYHFIIKESSNEFEVEFESLRENEEKCKSLSAPIEKEVTKLIKMVIKVLRLYFTT